jgi:hypothetical protein
MRSNQREIEESIRNSNSTVEGETEYEDQDELRNISHHKTYSNRSKSKAANKWCNSLVMVSNHGRQILNSQNGRFESDRVFTYVGQAFNGSAVIFPLDGNCQFNVPFDCLIFL